MLLKQLVISSFSIFWRLLYANQSINNTGPQSTHEERHVDCTRASYQFPFIICNWPSNLQKSIVPRNGSYKLCIAKMCHYPWIWNASATGLRLKKKQLTSRRELYLRARIRVGLAMDTHGRTGRRPNRVHHSRQDGSKMLRTTHILHPSFVSGLII